MPDKSPGSPSPSEPSRCPVCGSIMKENVCPRCGFKSEEAVFGDIRDEEAFRDYKTPPTHTEREKKIRMVLHNIDTCLLSVQPSREEVATTVSSGLNLLRVPLDVEERHSLRLSPLEREFLSKAGRLVDRIDEETGIPCLGVEQYIQMGNAFFSMGDTRRALGYYERGLLTHPLHPLAMYSKAAAYFQAGNREGAVRILEKLLEREPSNEKAKRLHALVLQMQ